LGAREGDIILLAGDFNSRLLLETKEMVQIGDDKELRELRSRDEVAQMMENGDGLLSGFSEADMLMQFGPIKYYH
jgi:hypothetical protein